MKTTLSSLVIAGLICTSHPLFAQGAPEKRVTDREAKKLAIRSPGPDYPFEARRRKITGSGVVLVRVNTEGIVTSVSMRQSTGSPILDRAATFAFKRWRFKTGQSFYFSCPITFTMAGASQVAAPEGQDARFVAISAPRPDYPYEARRQHMVGRGIVILEVESTTGKVTHAYMGQSTGYSLLDKSTLNTFRHWRFKPGTVNKVRIPIAYTMTGEVITTVHVDAKPMDKVLSPFLGKGTVINGPMPQYPRTVPWKEKRGQGLYELRVGPSGDAIHAKVLKSSGDVVFDQTTVAALENWRLRRGPVIIELPLSFHLTSTRYSVGIPKHP